MPETGQTQRDLVNGTLAALRAPHGEHPRRTPTVEERGRSGQGPERLYEAVA
jgi:hypothetical protein